MDLSRKQIFIVYGIIAVLLACLSPIWKRFNHEKISSKSDVVIESDGNEYEMEELGLEEKSAELDSDFKKEPLNLQKNDNSVDNDILLDSGIIVENEEGNIEITDSDIINYQKNQFSLSNLLHFGGKTDCNTVIEKLSKSTAFKDIIKSPNFIFLLSWLGFCGFLSNFYMGTVHTQLLHLGTSDESNIIFIFGLIININ